MMIHEYRTARSVCSFVEFISWAGVVLSSIVLLISLGTAFRGGEGVFALIAVAPAFSMLLFCFFMVLFVQLVRATMDGSVAAQKNVIQSQKQHDEMMRSFKQLAARPVSVADIAKKQVPNERVGTEHSAVATDASAITKDAPVGELW